MSAPKLFLTDLQRIELAIPAAAMLHVLDHAADPSDSKVRKVRRLLVGTVEDAMTGLAGPERRKLRARLDRTLRTFLAPIVRGGRRVDAVGLIAWHVLAALLEDGHLVLPEGTPLSDALAAMRPALERVAAVPLLSAYAAREWPRALYRLQSLGLFEEVGNERSTAA